MTGGKTLLNGIDEGITTLVSTKLHGAESPELVLQSVRNIFPDFEPKNESHEKPEFGKQIDISWSHENISLNLFLSKLKEQAILDTALDAMSINLKEDSTTFEILRQASLNGKIAFNIIDDKPLGGVIEISLSSPDLVEWLEAATWHKGRDIIPRNVNDEKMMNSDGDSATWY